MTHTINRPAARTIGRFLDAQRVIYPRILREIQQGRKRTHWMWFVFPQLTALAKSEAARYYGIADRAEALTYLDNPVLRLRLAECATAVLSHDRLMFSYPDDRKLRSSMTLFSQVVTDATLPNAVLDKFFGGPDPLTLDVLAGKSIEPSTAMGRVEVRRAAAVGRRQQPERPMERAEVRTFVEGFGLSPAATKHLVGKWMEDQENARTAGWESHGRRTQEEQER
jgi:uncharacterized protein (DUF1810 family)